MRSRGAHHRRRGLTIVELLVALTLVGLLSMIVLSVARVHTHMEQQDQDAQRALDNVRGAIEELRESLRATGGPFLSGIAHNAVPPASQPLLYAVTSVNNHLGIQGGNGPDELRLIRSDESAAGTLIAEAEQGTNPLLVSSANGLHTGDFVLLSDFNDAILYRLTAAPQAITYLGVSATQLRVTPPPAPPVTGFFPGALVHRAQPLSYHLDTTVIPGSSVLVLVEGVPVDMSQPPQLLAEYIEDLQVAIGVDGLQSGIQSGTIEEIGRAANDDEWVHNHAGEVLQSPLPPGSRITAVRITVVGRSAQESEQVGPGRPAVEDRPPGPPDRYRYRLLSTEVHLQSIAMN